MGANKLSKIHNKLTLMQIEDLDRLSEFQDIDLQRETSESKWSAIQVLNHLYMTEKGTINFLEKSLGKSDELGKVNFKNRFRAYLLQRFLKSKRKAKAPSKLPDPKNDTSLEELKSKFDRLHSQHDEFLNKVPSNIFGKTVFKHPYIGWMEINDVYRFMANHWAHHRHQLERIEKDLKNG
ncbi:DinB family protein [Luteibaculum oceani]|uniref:DinB family protein n=1 Tax=Luteibaculum oceani TaxID=1294296 RepID=A0A5C6VCS6_9FLAO|nr:DinB family protein [Luteibaculum oceani]TXC81355.1 DinB family protein [Luteibaculum oceani]